MSNNQKNTYTKEDFLQIIGYISAAFAALDFLTTMLICRMVDGENYEKLRIDNKTLGQKLRILKKQENTITDYPLCLSELKEALPEAIKIADERNRYIHDQWIFNDLKMVPGKISRLQIIRKNKLNINVINIKETVFEIDSFYKFRDQIILTQDKISEVLKKLPLINKDRVKI